MQSNVKLIKGVLATIYDYLTLTELLKMVLLSKTERAMIKQTTHKRGLIKPKPLSV